MNHLHPQKKAKLLSALVFLSIAILVVGLTMLKRNYMTTQSAALLQTQTETKATVVQVRQEPSRVSKVFYPAPPVFAKKVFVEKAATQLAADYDKAKADVMASFAKQTEAIRTAAPSQKTTPLDADAAPQLTDPGVLQPSMPNIFLVNGATTIGSGSGSIPFNRVAKTANATAWQYASKATDANGMADIANFHQDPFLQRQASAAVYFKNKIFVASGWNGDSQKCLADVWSSTTGRGWQLENDNPPWSAAPTSPIDNMNGRSEHTLTVFNDGSGPALYLIGGAYCKAATGATGGIAADVWKSYDGKNWTRVITSNSVLGARIGHTTVVYNNKLFVIGGFDGTVGYTNSVVWTSDGVNWHALPMTGNVWSPRADHASFVYNGKLYVVGGFMIDASPWQIYADPATIVGVAYYYSDIWTYTPGVWKKESALPGWAGRRGHSVEIMNGNVYLIGGSTSQGASGFSSEVWKSSGLALTAWTRLTDFTIGGTATRLVESASVSTPANFGSGIVGNPPGITSLNPIISGATTLAMRANLKTYNKPTDLWFKYDVASLFDENPLGHFLTQHSPISSISGVRQTVVNTLMNDTYYTYEAIATNDIGMSKYVVSASTGGCNNTLGQKIKLMNPSSGGTNAIGTGDVLVRGQSLSVTWQSCNISATAPIEILLYSYDNSSLVTLSTTVNDGSENVVIPATMLPGQYALAITQPGISLWAGSTKVMIQ